MLKNYINVRVFVMLDLSLAATWILLSIGGWSVIKAYPQVDAIIWGIISIPLALIAVYMIYHRANLVHRKHVNNQYIYEQEQEIRLQQLRSQSLPYPNMVVDDENERLQSRLQGQQPVAKIAAAKIADENANFADDVANFASDETDDAILAAFQQLTNQHKKPTGIAIAQLTGIPQRTVYDRLKKLQEA